MGVGGGWVGVYSLWRLENGVQRSTYGVILPIKMK